MEPITQISLGTLILFFIVFLIKRYHSLKGSSFNHVTMFVNSFVDALTLNSSLILIFYLIGNSFDVPLFSSIDAYALNSSIILSALVVFAHSLNNFQIKRQNKDYEDNKPEFEPEIEVPK